MFKKNVNQFGNLKLTYIYNQVPVYVILTITLIVKKKGKKISLLIFVLRQVRFDFKMIKFVKDLVQFGD